jgi:hypothetical protein
MNILIRRYILLHEVQKLIAFIFQCNLQLIHISYRNWPVSPLPRIPNNLDVNVLRKRIGRVAGWQGQIVFETYCCER